MASVPAADDRRDAVPLRRLSTEKRACERRTVSIYRSKDLMNWDYIWHTERVSGPNPDLTKYLQSADRSFYYVLGVHKRTRPRGPAR